MSNRSRPRNITNDLLCIPNTTGNDKPKRHAWTEPNVNISESGNDMMDEYCTKLMEMFPDYNASLVQDVLEHHKGNFDHALQALLEMVPVNLVQSSVSAIGKTKKQEPPSNSTPTKPIFMHPVRSIATVSETPKDDDCPTSTSSDWNVHKSRKKKHTAPKSSTDERGQTIRQQARALDTEHKSLLSVATSLRHKGRPAESNRLLLQAEQVKADRDALNQRAALAIFAEQNPRMDSVLSIDLHFLSEHEALHLLARHLPRLAASARREGERWVQVVVGAGTHSAGGRGVLEPAVEDWLRCRGVAVRRGDPGVLWAQASDVLRTA